MPNDKNRLVDTNQESGYNDDDDHDDDSKENEENDISNQSRSKAKSKSRKARRDRMEKAIENGKYMKTSNLEPLQEADTKGELSKMGMLERIGPDSTSMNGPVTHARAMRGEIPMRGIDTAKITEEQSQSDEQEGLKLKIVANLEVEIELKASIRGDLTLCLFA